MKAFWHEGQVLKLAIKGDSVILFGNLVWPSMGILYLMWVDKLVIVRLH